MPLSEWPEHFRGDDFDDDDFVDVNFENPMLVQVETPKAYGFSESMNSRKVSFWIPKSQLDESFEVKEEVDSLRIPRWLAESNDLI